MAVDLVIHGGAGEDVRGSSPRETAALLAGARAALRAVCSTGMVRLRRGDTAEDVVQWAVEALEDYPFFNAGRGAAPNEDGHYRMDACFVSGAGYTGACALADRVRNPVRLARAIAEHPAWRDQLIAGEAATRSCAQALGVPCVGPGYFYSSLARKMRRVHRSLGSTVGAVARDGSGRLAAASSTGGLQCRRRGRIGDTPVVNLSTFAENGVGAIALTGRGETIRSRGTLLRLMRHWGRDGAGLGAAARRALAETGAGTAGLIALGAEPGRAIVCGNTPRMFWARATGGSREVQVGTRPPSPTGQTCSPGTSRTSTFRRACLFRK